MLLAALTLLGQDQSFDVRNGDQRGKLTVADGELRFDSLTDAKQSRAWKYGEIRSFEKKRKAFRVRGFSGPRYDFQFPSNADRDKVFDLISPKIIAGRQTKR
jgi:hypothetical protein